MSRDGVLTASLKLYSGAGNTFVLLDNREGGFDSVKVPELCKASETDGVILLENSSSSDYKMVIFNRDGSEATACGNGTRCYAKYLEELGLIQEKAEIESAAGPLFVEIIGEEVSVNMPTPRDIKWNVTLEAAGKIYSVDLLNTGVPHVVVFCEEVNSIDVERLGSAIRHHPQLQPEGANVDFVTIHSEQLHIRTFERGVERETMACGTGAIASALAAANRFGLTPPILVSVRSKEILTIHFSAQGEVMMRGPAHPLFANKPTVGYDL